MKNSSDSISSKGTIQAAGSVLNILPQFGALIIGFSALTYVAGLREITTYYQELGAPWAVSLLTASQIMQTSIWLFSLIAILSFSSFYALVQGSASQKSLRRGSIIFLLLAAVCVFAPFFLDKYLGNSVIIFLSYLVSIFWVISAGITIGELISCLAMDEFKWGEYHIFLLFFVILYFGIWQAPYNMGVTRAKQTGDISYSLLPKVTITSTSQNREWRLVGPLGDKFLLVSLSKDRKDRRFKIVSADAAGEIFVPRSN